MLCTKFVTRVNSKSSHQKERYVFYLFNFLSVGDNGWSVNLLSSSFYDVFKLTRYAEHLKLIQSFMSTRSQIKLEEKEEKNVEKLISL